MPKAPPKFVTQIGAWNYTLAKLDEKGKLTENGDPQNYAAACAIYKNVVKKYPAMNVADAPPIKAGFMLPSDVDKTFPAGSHFWWEDCICEVEAVRDGIGGVIIMPDGALMLHGKILDVDPDGPHKDWVGRSSTFSASRCLPLDHMG